MMERLFHLKEIVEIYGLTTYEAKTLMARVPKINVGRGSERPRWVVRQSEIDAYLRRKAKNDGISGLDMFGKIMRRR